MIVVEVFTTNCQVSENPNSGPVAAYRMMAMQHRTNVSGRPAARDTECANCVKIFSMRRVLRQMRGQGGEPWRGSKI
jgi:hypothetical protein